MLPKSNWLPCSVVWQGVNQHKVVASTTRCHLHSVPTADDKRHHETTVPAQHLVHLAISAELHLSVLSIQQYAERYDNGAVALNKLLIVAEKL